MPSKEVTISKHQNIIDLVLQEYGSVEGLIPFARQNGLRVDESFVLPQTVLVDPADIVKPDIVTFLAGQGSILNTGEAPDLVGAIWVTETGEEIITEVGQTILTE